jgi:hypothetical protein
LEVSCGNLEECNLLPLDTFKTQWPLSSLLIAGNCLSNFEEGMVPKVCNSVTSLVLDTCNAFNYAPPAGTDALRHLTIIDNDALQMFVCIRKNMREVDHLQKLKLVDVRAYLDRYSRDEWRTALKGCTSLKSLDMVLDTTGYSLERPVVEDLLEGIDEVLETVWLDDEKDTEEDEEENVHRNLPAYLPNSLEHLRLQGSPRMVRHLGPWLHHARDPSWLPNLQTISFSLDLATREGYGYNAEYKPSEAQRKVIAAVGPYAKRFLETFSISHPDVQVLD